MLMTVHVSRLELGCLWIRRREYLVHCWMSFLVGKWAVQASGAETGDDERTISLAQKCCPTLALEEKNHGKTRSNRKSSTVPIYTSGHWMKGGATAFALEKSCKF